ncbi:unnamed protein product, partial [Discosporangium mesarthrocarpum]
LWCCVPTTCHTVGTFVNIDLGPGLRPDVYTYASILRCMGLSLHWEMALETLRQMPSEGVRPNLVVYNTVISSLGRSKQVR